MANTNNGFVVGHRRPLQRQQTEMATARAPLRLRVGAARPRPRQALLPAAAATPVALTLRQQRQPQRLVLPALLPLRLHLQVNVRNVKSKLRSITAMFHSWMY